jgi:hypothetical protein
MLPLLILLLAACCRCNGKPSLGLRGGDGDMDRGRDRDRGRKGNMGSAGGGNSFRVRGRGEMPPSVADHAVDPAGALLAEYQNGPWSAGGGGAHAHRALTTTVEVTSVFKAVASDGLADALFGFSVVTNGSITVVGAYNDNGGKGKRMQTLSLHRSC